jgi:transcriptional regulator GlxA family with amidase domain
MGAHNTGYTLTSGEKAFLQRCNNESTALLFICGGFEAALQAGILAGKTATGPRPMVPMLQQMAPDVNWVTKRWANDGKIWTSGALLNGTDMTAAFVTKYFGGEGSLVEFGLRLGGYPIRDIDYKDVEWDL